MLIESCEFFFLMVVWYCVDDGVVIEVIDVEFECMNVCVDRREVCGIVYS